MANIKDVNVAGTIPYDLNGNREMLNLLGQFNMPVCGLRITWDGEAGYEENEHNGRTCLYNFNIRGQEAVSWSFLDKMIETIKESGGKITEAIAADIEDSPGKYVNLLE